MGRVARVAKAVLVSALFAAGGAAAEPGYSFDTTPGRLPKTVVPLHYAIELQPDLERLTLAGLAQVDIEVREPTAQITLNAVNMTLTAASVADGAQSATIVLDAAAETATLTFAQPLRAGLHQLRIAFTAEINRFGRGLFYIDYPTANGRKRMISSHLEPADARRVFPCWDEPAFKATFALTVTVPDSFVAVSNMPVAHEQPVTPSLKQVSFQPTPRMSSYLFVLTAGELERISSEADGVAVSVVTTAGKRQQGRFALESAVDLLRYFNDYFGVPYPLPKLDLIALPGGFGGAMENWGGITFFESRLLFDPALNPAGARRGIFSILAHEMAHQWFGNLVTMAWWDNLWLNEGFATWMQAKAAEHLHPQWATWLNSGGQKQFAMSLDARSSSHPIQQPVENETEAMAVFDAITYSKGQALIRMLEHYLGDERVSCRHPHLHGRTRLRQYHDCGSVAGAGGRLRQASRGVGVALYRASRCAAGDRGGDLHWRRAARAFAARAVYAARSCRYPPLPRRCGGKTKRWQLPVAIGPLRAVRAPETILLDGETAIAAGRCGEPVKVNLGDVGYYRVEYDAVSRAALAKSMALMAPADRVNLLADSWALVEAARAEARSYFELIEQVSRDDVRAVWEQIVGTLSRLDRLARGRDEQPALRAFARSKLRPVFDRLGWDVGGSEDDDGALLRVRLIRMLGELGDADIVAEAKRRFAAFPDNPAALPPGLRDAVAHVVGLSADRATYDQLIALARKTTDTSERVRYYSAAAGARDPGLARATLALTLTDELPSNLVGTLINAVAAAGEQPELAWAFLRENFQTLATRQGPSFRNYFVSNFMTNFSDAARAAELAAFAPVQATSGGRMVAARSAEAIVIGSELKARALPAIDGWLRRRGGRD